MNFNRRSFLKSVSVAFGAAVVVKIAPAHVPLAVPGQSDGDMWLCVSWIDGQRNGLKMAVANMRNRLEEINPRLYRFYEMELPISVDYAKSEIICGVPMRHIRTWHPVENRMYNRLDVLARRIA